MNKEINIKFEPRDMWVGIHWNKFHFYDHWGDPNRHGLKIYICIVPMFPIVIELDWWMTKEETKRLRA